MYDEQCMDFYVAVRAIWLLWRRGAWTQLGELGLTREMIDEAFTGFDLVVLDEYQRVLKTDRQTELLLHSLSDETRKLVRSAALTLNLTYAALYEQRKPTPQRHAQSHTKRRAG